MEFWVEQYVECRAPNPKRGAEDDIIFWGEVVKITPRPGDGDRYWITVRPISSCQKITANREVTEDRVQPLRLLDALAAASDGEDWRPASSGKKETCPDKS
jgi:hypothetical protein